MGNYIAKSFNFLVEKEEEEVENRINKLEKTILDIGIMIARMSGQINEMYSKDFRQVVSDTE